MRAASIVLAIVLIVGCASVTGGNVNNLKDAPVMEEPPRYNHESKISPDVFMEWEVVYSSQVVLRGEIMFFIISKNPDPTADIKNIESIYHSSGMLITFGYVLNDVVWVFRYNPETNTYEQTQPEKPETLNVQEPQKKPNEG